MKDPIQVYTDGSCKPVPGRGGWACILVYPDKSELVLAGNERRTVPERMEIMAAIAALEYLPDGQTVQITTDSRFLRNAMTRWIHEWRKRGWVRGRVRNPEPVKNRDLWERLDKAAQCHSVAWRWAKRGEYTLNSFADRVARQARSKAEDISRIQYESKGLLYLRNPDAEDLGRIACENYWKNLNPENIPAWETLSAQERGAWEQAALAVESSL